jgi:hypothetical protein
MQYTHSFESYVKLFTKQNMSIIKNSTRHAQFYYIRCLFGMLFPHGRPSVNERSSKLFCTHCTTIYISAWRKAYFGVSPSFVGKLLSPLNICVCVILSSDNIQNTNLNVQRYINHEEHTYFKLSWVNGEIKHNVPYSRVKVITL